jgi:hypothetical protein
MGGAVPETWTSKRHDGTVLVVALVLLLMGAAYIWHEDNGCNSEIAGNSYFDRNDKEWRKRPSCG